MTTTITEDEMSRVMQTLQGLFNAAQEGSKLAVQFAQYRDEMAASQATLKSEMEELKRDIEYVRERNKRLDAESADLRRQRDEAQNELVLTRSDLAQEKEKNAGLERTCFIANQELAARHERIDSLTKERDDALFRVMELEEEVKAFRSKLEAVTTALGLPTPATTASEPEKVEERKVEQVGISNPSYGQGGSGPETRREWNYETSAWGTRDVKTGQWTKQPEQASPGVGEKIENTF